MKLIQDTSQASSYHYSSKFQGPSSASGFVRQGECSRRSYQKLLPHDVTSPWGFTRIVAAAAAFGLDFRDPHSVTTSWQGRAREPTYPERRPDHGVAGDCAASICLLYTRRGGTRGQADCQSVSQCLSLLADRSSQHNTSVRINNRFDISSTLYKKKKLSTLQQSVSRYTTSFL